MCRETVDLSRWNSSAIWSSDSHTVSSTMRTSTRVPPSSVWYQTICEAGAEVMSAILETTTHIQGATPTLQGRQAGPTSATLTPSLRQICTENLHR